MLEYCKLWIFGWYKKMCQMLVWATRKHETTQSSVNNNRKKFTDYYLSFKYNTEIFITIKATLKRQ